MVTAEIRNTGGDWGAYTDDECKISTNDPAKYTIWGDCAPYCYYTYTLGKYQQQNGQTYLGPCYPDCGCDPSPYACSVGANCNANAALACLSPMCVGPDPKVPNTYYAPWNVCYRYCNYEIKWREWGCP